jgi:D-alanyl-D-alanine carboxypeptidase/D-alanyl-D-alanine-endopeptidase (penicillin-binding protein 4)
MRRGITIGLLLVCGWIVRGAAADEMLEEIKALAGDGVVVVVDGEGTKLVDMNSERAFIPASTLKVVTGLASMEVLGPDHRFETRFYVDEAGWLYVEGRGDPFLVSEELDLLAPALLAKGKTEFTGIVLDDSYYADGIKIPGTSGSDRPYDSLNSALAVNFNTLFVVISGDTVTSAEEQTPVVPISIEAAKESGHSGEIRINLASDPGRALLYAGQLIRAKLTTHGATIGDEMRSGAVPEGLEPLYVHANSRPLSEVVGSMLYWSNNYAANQLLLEMGALRLGGPATLDKGVEVVRGVLADHGLAESITYVEGSGLSRDNHVTPAAMLTLLDAFRPHKSLLRDRRGSMAKTGTLSICKTIVGYLDTADHGEVLFVFSLAGNKHKQRFDLIDVLKKHL